MLRKITPTIVLVAVVAAALFVPAALAGERPPGSLPPVPPRRPTVGPTATPSIQQPERPTLPPKPSVGVPAVVNEVKPPRPDRPPKPASPRGAPLSHPPLLVPPPRRDYTPPVDQTPPVPTVQPVNPRFGALKAKLEGSSIPLGGFKPMPGAPSGQLDSQVSSPLVFKSSSDPTSKSTQSPPPPIPRSSSSPGRGRLPTISESNLRHAEYDSRAVAFRRAVHAAIADRPGPSRCFGVALSKLPQTDGSVGAVPDPVHDQVPLLVARTVAAIKAMGMGVFEWTAPADVARLLGDFAASCDPSNPVLPEGVPPTAILLYFLKRLPKSILSDAKGTTYASDLLRLLVVADVVAPSTVEQVATMLQALRPESYRLLRFLHLELFHPLVAQLVASGRDPSSAALHIATVFYDVLVASRLESARPLEAVAALITITPDVWGLRYRVLGARAFNIITALIEAIENNKDYEVEGIYRQSASKNRTDQIVDGLVDSPTWSRVLDEAMGDSVDSLTRGAVLKQVIGHLRWGMFTESAIAEVIKFMQEGSSSDARDPAFIEFAAQLLAGLPELNCAILLRFLRHLTLVAESAGKNKMNAHNLGVMAVNALPVPAENMLVLTALRNGFLQMLIQGEAAIAERVRVLRGAPPPRPPRAVKPPRSD